MFSKSGKLVKPRVRAGHTLWHVYCIKGILHMPHKVTAKSGPIYAPSTKGKYFTSGPWTEHHYSDIGVMAKGRPPYNQNRMFKTREAAIRHIVNGVTLGLGMVPALEKEVLAQLPGFKYTPGDLTPQRLVEIETQMFGCDSSRTDRFRSWIDRLVLRDTHDKLPTGYGHLTKGIPLVLWPSLTQKQDSFLSVTTGKPRLPTKDTDAFVIKNLFGDTNASNT